ncbi:DUF4097 domain-containing protein [Paenibacillus sacheonensis]|uniref:Adhesin domain-containing protein n=1 Tax=Paenibacillus sacheonensis TaxID=742054 RepID=A0A7X5C0L0_9BACL|nr:DUF4097 domain-containing protein [Paenibacillus sacheonensis]MBM7564827.1 hypothetical protein [Paenibacillus sacheonensis]NBC69375.1 hypothetical protein [Paenibacillus sacheonensis]
MILRTNRIVLLLAIVVAFACSILDMTFLKEDMFEHFARKLVNEEKTSSYEHAHPDVTTFAEGQYAVDRGKIREVSLANRDGAIVVRQAEGNRIQLRYKVKVTSRNKEGTERRQTAVKADKDPAGERLTLTATVDGKPVEGGRVSVDYELLVPSGLKLDIKSERGSVSVLGTKGDLGVRSDNGMLEIQQVDGRLMADVAHGNAYLSGITGGIDLKNEFSDVTIEQAKGAVKLDSSNGVNAIGPIEGALTGRAGEGTLMLRAVGGTIDLTAVAANVQVTELRGNARIRPESSDVTVLLDKTGGYTLDTVVKNGHIGTQLPLVVKRDPAEGNIDRLRGSLGDGKWTIAIDGVVSDIHLYTRTAAAVTN